MSELLQRWLNQDVGLSRTVHVFERDFSNGYLFGELLHKHGLLDDFADIFVDDNRVAVKRANLKELKDALSDGPAASLGIKLRAEQIAQIMDEDRGCSLRLLFQFRKGLNGQASRQAPHLKNATDKLVRQPREVHEERFFDASLKKLKRTEPRNVHEFNVKDYYDEHTRQMAKAAADEQAYIDQTLQRNQDFRSSRHAVMADHKMRVAETDYQNAEGHQKNIRRKLANVETDLVFEKFTIKREMAKIDRSRDMHIQDCGYLSSEENHGIGWFEKNLQRIGIDTSELAGASEATIQAADAKELYDQMRDKFDPAAAELKKECTLRMKKIKEAKRASDQAQKERERRRRRALLKQEEEQAADEERKQQEALLLQSEAVKGALEYEEQTQFYSEANHKAALLIQRRARGLLARKMLRRRHRSNLKKAATERSEQTLNEMTTRVMGERTEKLEEKKRSADLAQIRGAEGILREAEPSSDDEPEWDPFRKGLEETIRSAVSPIDRSLEASPEPADAEPTVAPAEVLVEHVKDPRVSEYLFARGHWGRCIKSLPQDESEQLKPQLGGLVRWLLGPSAETCEAAQLPTDYMPIIAITGCPARLGNRGVGEQAAQKICAELGYALVEPRKVVEECVTLARKEEQEPEWPMLGRLYQLGRAVLDDQATRGTEATVPHATLVEMIVRKIELLSSPPPKQEEEEEPVPDPKKKAKKPPAKKEDEKPQPVRPNGIVILGYLSDFEQQSAWESALRGYMSPLLRINDGEADMQAQLSSILAPYVAEQVSAEGYTVQPAVAQEPPMRLLRLQFENHAELCNKIALEAANDKAWRVGDQAPASDEPVPPPSAAGAKGKGGRGSPAAAAPAEAEAAEAAPVMLSSGYEQEYSAIANPVDRAWLYEDAQTLVGLFTRSLGTCQDIIPQPQVSEETVESMDNALCRQVLELASQWQRPAPGAAEDPEGGGLPGEAAVEFIPEGEDDKLPAPEENTGDDKGQELLAMAPGPWLQLPEDKRGPMKNAWLELVSKYVTNLHAAIDQLHEKTNGYGTSLVKMQRNFLEFLQKNDEKSHVLEEYLKSWPQRSHGRHHDAVLEEIEELSDRLWQFTDRRRADAVEELARLMESCFWEEQAQMSLQLAADLYGVEYSRYQAAARMLCQVYAYEPAGESHLTDLPSSSLEGLSTLQELGDWLQGLTANVAEDAMRKAPVPPEIGEAGEDEAAREAQDDLPEADATTPGEGDTRLACSNAILAEKRMLMRRVQAVEVWVLGRLALMREQLEEAFRRMDDWIRDRVRMENEAIKAAIAQLQGTAWVPGATDESMSPSKQHTRSGSKSRSRQISKPSPTGGPVRRRRREVQKALEARTLDVDVLIPEKLQVEASVETGPAPPLQGSLALARRPSGQGAKSSMPDGRWSQDMLRGLLQQLMQRTSGAAACSPDDVLAVLLERRLSGYSFDVDQVPAAWVRRSEASLAAFCLSFASGRWGDIAVDVTELLLALTMHDRNLPWPSPEALLASRHFIESSASGLSPEQLERYPDVPISEDLFLKLPLWPVEAYTKLNEEPQNERGSALKRWIFAVLQCFEDQATPRLPDAATVGTSSLTSGAGISARRLFTYLGMGVTPMAGAQLAFQLLLSPHQSTTEEGEEAEGSSQIFVHQLWAVLFSAGGARPGGAAAPAPELADFCRELTTPEGAEAEAAEVDPAEEPPAPETITIPFEEKALLRKATVLRALCTHGGLLCKKRALATLFPTSSTSGLTLHNSAESAEAKGLVSMVPTPPPTQESAPPEDAEGAL